MNNTDKIKLFTDSDLDGVSCGVIAQAYFGDNVDITFSSPKLIEEEIKKFIDNNEYVNYRKVFITDLSVSVDMAEVINNTFKPYIIKLLDHHKTARKINDYSWATVTEYLNNRKTCGAELFWEYLKEYFIFTGEEDVTINVDTFNKYVEYVRLYDTWEWQESKDGSGEISQKLNMILHMYSNTKFLKSMVRKLRNENPLFIDKFEERLIDVEENRKRRYINQKAETMRKISISESRYAGVVFAENYISELGNYLCKMNEDIDYVMIINTDFHSISLRTVKDDIDVSEIARQNGGGGHPKAAGYTYDKDKDDKILNYILFNK